MQVTATEFKNRIGQYMDTAETVPVIVKKSGRVKSVLISSAMYERFLEYEDAYWATRAMKAEESGFIGEAAAAELLDWNPSDA